MREWPEKFFIACVCLLIGCALFLPPIGQDQSYHAFADRRPWGPVPNAADTLSNLAFLIAGLWGLWKLANHRGFAPNPLICRLVAALLIGVLLTGLASMFYHLAPSDPRLAVDRLAMSLSFAAALALLAADRVSVRLAIWIMICLLLSSMPSIRSSNFHFGPINAAVAGICKQGGMYCANCSSVCA